RLRARHSRARRSRAATRANGAKVTLVLNDLRSVELVAAAAPLGVPEGVARRLFAAVHQRGAPARPEYERVRGLSRRGAPPPARARRRRPAGPSPRPPP